MISIGDEISRSRQAADEIVASGDDAQKKKRLAEEMARASGGVSPKEAWTYDWSPVRVAHPFHNLFILLDSMLYRHFSPGAAIFEFFKNVRMLLGLPFPGEYTDRSQVVRVYRQA